MSELSKLMPTVFDIPDWLAPKMESLEERAMALIHEMRERDEDGTESLVMLSLAIRLFCFALATKQGIDYVTEIERMEAHVVAKLLGRWQDDGVHPTLQMLRFSSGLTAIANLYLEKVQGGEEAGKVVN